MEVVISGGQTGADLAGIDWAISNSIPYMVNIFEGFKPVNGRDLTPYNVTEIPTPNLSYTDKLKYRTQHNILKSNGTLVFIDKHLSQSRGSLYTVNLCQEYKRPYMIVPLDLKDAKDMVIKYARGIMKDSRVLNIAGSRSCDEEKVRDLLGEIYDSL